MANKIVPDHGTQNTLRTPCPVFYPLFPTGASTNNATLTTEAAKSVVDASSAGLRAFSLSGGTSRFSVREGSYVYLTFAVPADGETATAYVWLYGAYGFESTTIPSYGATKLVPSLVLSLSITGGTRAVDSEIAGGATLVWADTVAVTSYQIGSGWLAESDPNATNGICYTTFDRGFAWAAEVEVKRGTAATVQGWYGVV